jgi:ribosomal protein S2
MEDFIEIAKIINKQYGVSGVIIGENEKFYVLQKWSYVYMIKINVGVINTTALWNTIKEYTILFEMMFAKSKIEEYEGHCFKFIK